MPNIKSLIKQFNGCCAYCGVAVEVHMPAKGKAMPPNAATRDHFIPKRAGVKHGVVLACLECNKLKGCINPKELHIFLERFTLEKLAAVEAKIKGATV